MADEPVAPPPDTAATPAGVPTERLPALNILQVKSNERLDQEAAVAKQEAKPTVKSAPKSALAGFIETRFREAERAMMYLQTEDMMEQLRRRAGVYNPSRMAEIKKQGGSEVWVKITETECLKVEALIGEVVVPEGDRPWDLKPRNRPSLSPDDLTNIVQQTLKFFAGRETEVGIDEVRDKAREIRTQMIHDIQEVAVTRSSNMADLIDDQFTEGHFYDEMEDTISDIVSVGTGVMRGPYLQMQRMLDWTDQKKAMAEVIDIPLLKWDRRDPLYIFPSPGSTDIENATYICDRDEFTRSTLLSMIGVPGWNEANIRDILARYQSGTRVWVYTDAERAILERRRSDEKTNPDDKFQCVWYVGEAYGPELKAWGIEGVKDDQVHEIIAIYMGDQIIHCRLNSDPLHRRFYTKSVYKPVKGSFWGQGVPKLMDDIQDNCNASARALINNCAIASGPQVVFNDISRNAEGQTIQDIYPWRIWQGNKSPDATRPLVEFFQPELNAEKMMEIFKFFLSMADERVGVPQYQPAPGSGTGVDSTATGLTIRLNQTSRVLKMSIRYIDRGIIKPNVMMTFFWNMKNIDDPRIKGDVECIASGAMGLFVKEQQQLRIKETLRLTANPVDLSIIKRKGRAALLRADVAGIVGLEDMVPPEDELDREDELAAAQAKAQGQQPAPQPAPQ